jgi:type IV secretion system protein VirB10
MKAKLWIPVVVLVAGLAFGLGWWYRSQSANADEVAAFEPATTSAPAYAAPVAPARATPRRTPAAPATSTQAVEVASAAPVASAAEVSAPQRLTVAEGTKIVFTLNNGLSTKSNREGDPFSGVVSRSVRVGDQIVIPEGSVIRGQVSHVQRPGRVKGRGELGLRFDRLEIPGGPTYDLSASLTNLDEQEKETVTEEGQVKGEGSKKRDAAEIGAGAGIGAVIGAIAGGGKGAAIGAGGGAAAVTGLVLLQRGKDIDLKRGREMAIQLDRPLTIDAR